MCQRFLNVASARKLSQHGYYVHCSIWQTFSLFYVARTGSYSPQTVFLCCPVASCCYRTPAEGFLAPAMSLMGLFRSWVEGLKDPLLDAVSIVHPWNVCPYEDAPAPSLFSPSSEVTSISTDFSGDVIHAILESESSSAASFRSSDSDADSFSSSLRSLDASSSSSSSSSTIIFGERGGSGQKFFYKSQSYSPIVDPPPTFTAIKTSNDGLVAIAITASNGVYMKRVSTRALSSSAPFVSLPASPTSLHLVDLAIDAEGRSIFVVSDSSSTLYSSRDYGVTWSAAPVTDDLVLLPKSISCSSDCRLIAIASSDTSVTEPSASHTASGAVYLSSDSGSTWFSAAGSLPDLPFVSVYVFPDASYVVASSTSLAGTSYVDAELYMSYDSGLTFDASDQPLLVVPGGSLIVGGEKVALDIKGMAPWHLHYKYWNSPAFCKTHIPCDTHQYYQDGIFPKEDDGKGTSWPYARYSSLAVPGSSSSGSLVYFGTVGDGGPRSGAVLQTCQFYGRNDNAARLYCLALLFFIAAFAYIFGVRLFMILNVVLKESRKRAGSAPPGAVADSSNKRSLTLGDILLESPVHPGEEAAAAWPSQSSGSSVDVASSDPSCCLGTPVDYSLVGCLVCGPECRVLKCHRPPPPAFGRGEEDLLAKKPPEKGRIADEKTDHRGAALLTYAAYYVDSNYSARWILMQLVGSTRDLFQGKLSMEEYLNQELFTDYISSLFFKSGYITSPVLPFITGFSSILLLLGGIILFVEGGVDYFFFLEQVLAGLGLMLYTVEFCVTQNRGEDVVGAVKETVKKKTNEKGKDDDGCKVLTPFRGPQEGSYYDMGYILLFIQHFWRFMFMQMQLDGDATIGGRGENIKYFFFITTVGPMVVCLSLDKGIRRKWTKLKLRWYKEVMGRGQRELVQIAQQDNRAYTTNGSWQLHYAMLWISLNVCWISEMAIPFAFGFSVIRVAIPAAHILFSILALVGMWSLKERTMRLAHAASNTSSYAEAWENIKQRYPEELARVAIVWDGWSSKKKNDLSTVIMRQGFGTIEDVFFEWNELDEEERSKQRTERVSISLLFNEADIANPLLQGLATKWARECRGHAKPSPVKTTTRAVQKLYRSYAMEWERLCDLVRTSIVFEDMAALCRCLEIILVDPAVEVVFRGNDKCRLRLDFDATDKGAYRDIQLSIRMRHEAAVKAGVQYHVCEVQLHMLTMFNAKSESGHKAYKRRRNMLGE